MRKWKGELKFADSDSESNDSEERRPKEMKRSNKILENDYESSDSDEKKIKKMSDSDSDDFVTKKKTSKKAENKTKKLEENYFIGINEEKNFKVIKTIAESETSTIYKLIDKTSLQPICKKSNKSWRNNIQWLSKCT